VLGLKGTAAAELVFAGEEEIRRVNRETRGIDRVTDVLSFPMLTVKAGEYPAFKQKNFPADFDPDLNAVCIGSIMICKAVAARQAEEYGHSIAREEGYLFVHGLLHLLGFDHETEGDKRQMRGVEERILKEVL
jgi:probable rRNA maturation factor